VGGKQTLLTVDSARGTPLLVDLMWGEFGGGCRGGRGEYMIGAGGVGVGWLVNFGPVQGAPSLQVNRAILLVQAVKAAARASKVSGEVGHYAKVASQHSQSILASIWSSVGPLSLENA
jgi:hypothetical protein